MLHFNLDCIKLCQDRYNNFNAFTICSGRNAVKAKLNRRLFKCRCFILWDAVIGKSGNRRKWVSH